MAKKYNTERYVRIFWHIYYKWSILIIQYKINIKFTFTVHECLIVYEYIWIYSIIQFEIYIYIYIYTIYLLYIYYNTIYIYICIYVYTIYIYMNFVLFVYCNIVATHTYDGYTGFTFTWSFPAGFTSRNDLHNCQHDPSY